MAEQTFRSPDFFDREIDLETVSGNPVGVPAGVIGTSKRGPAFVPVKVATFQDFKNKFGSLDPDKFGPYAVKSFLDGAGPKPQRTSLTFMRVLGAGANSDKTDIIKTQNLGIVKNAGFQVTGALHAVATNEDLISGPNGQVQFLCARHFVSASTEAKGFPIFSDNDSFVGTSTGDDDINLVRGILFSSSGSRFTVVDYDQNGTNIGTDNTAKVAPNNATPGMLEGQFKLILSSTAGSNFGNDDSPGLKVFTASLNPSSQFYISKILNTNPQKFQEAEHLLYVDFAVDHEVAPVSNHLDSVGVLSGSGFQSSNTQAGVQFNQLFGRFDTRYTTPKTTYFISQLFGQKEYDLFYFETLDDGTVAADEFKVSIANIRASLDKSQPYPSFEVQIRRFDDVDTNPQVIERFTNCNLDPKSDRYVAKLIGDRKVTFNFDAELEEERRLISTGRFLNKSSVVRIQVNASVARGAVPKSCAPFGFRGISTVKTSDSLTDNLDETITNVEGRALGFTTSDVVVEGTPPTQLRRLALGIFHAGLGSSLTGSIVPPLPYRFKITRNPMADIDTPAEVGYPGQSELTDSRFYWGVQGTSVPAEGSGPGQLIDAILRPNGSDSPNSIVKSYTKFHGIKKMDALVTGSAADYFNNNKFTLAKVCLLNTVDASGHITDITGSAKEHMRGAAYIRNGRPSSTGSYIIEDPNTDAKRISFMTLLNSSSVVFNRFTRYAKFTNIFHGGFDGLNILDPDQFEMNDRASSIDTGGKASSTYSDNGLSTQVNGSSNPAGAVLDNSIVASYRSAIKIMTDKYQSDINILAIPGIREPLITDLAMQRIKDDYKMAFFVMDIQHYDENNTRLFMGAQGKVRDVQTSVELPAVQNTSENFESRAVNNNYAGTYFPDVFIPDAENKRVVKVPSSVVALQALGFNDSARFEWFAPAGFSRGSLDNVVNVDVRLTAANRDTLYDARINPIATFAENTFPGQFVVYGQKTLQITNSALDRINVRRMLLEVKRQIIAIARGILFEQNTPATRTKFITLSTSALAIIQSFSGIEQFRIIMDDTNNTADDVMANRLNGRIVVVPTRTVEFIAIDFVVDKSGVSFT